MTTVNTPNYAWPTPGDDERRAKGAEAMRALGQAADATVKALDTRLQTQLDGTAVKVRQGTYSATLGAFQTMDVPLPGGQFTVPPLVVAVNGDFPALNYPVMGVSAVTIAKFTVAFYSGGTNIAGRAARVNWIAIGA